MLGSQPETYRCSVESRIDYLACCGAGFHNDVSRHWSRCLFWLLALDATDVELVMPHAGLRLPVAPGDLLVFDQDLDVKNNIHCNYLVGLGMLGLGKKEKAKNYFTNVLHKDLNHQGAAIHVMMINFLAQLNKSI